MYVYNGCITLWPCHFHEKKGVFLRQKKNYGNSNISPCKCIILKKIPLEETKIMKKGEFLKAKEELWKLKYCTMQTYNLLQKIL